MERMRSASVKLKNALGHLRSCRGKRKGYTSEVQWVKGTYASFLEKYAQMRRVGGAGREVLLGVKGMAFPLRARLGTQDILVIEEIFCDEIYDCVKREIPSLGSVVDLGGNVGMSCVYWKKLNKGARIVAVEPDRANQMQFEKNTAVLEEPGPRLMKAAVGAMRRRGELNRDAGSLGYSLKEGESVEAGFDSVEVITMDDVLEAMDAMGRRGEEIDLLKCDIEGGERELFSRAGGWLRRMRYLLIELHGTYDEGCLMRDLETGGVRAEVKLRLPNNGLPVLFMKLEGR